MRALGVGIARGTRVCRAALAVSACALGLTAVATSPPAQAAGATECVFDGTLNLAPGATFPPTGPPGTFTFTALAVVCAGSLTGTGVMTVTGNYFPASPNVFVTGTASMTVATTTCTGTFNGIVIATLVSATASTTCGDFTIPAVIVPLGGPTVTVAHLAGTMTSARTASCFWAAGSGCSYVADSTFARAAVVSPTAPTVTGASASWTPVPLPGTGTSMWIGAISQSPGATVTIGAPANTSGGAVSSP